MAPLLGSTFRDAKAILRTRLPLLTACALAGMCGALWHRPPAPTVQGVADMLGEAIHGQVAPDGFVWEHGAGHLLDVLFGRSILFLGSAKGDAPRDLYRAVVRVTREGSPLDVRAVHNLTRTSLADERSLIAADHHAAFAVVAFDAVQAVSLLDLAAPRPSGLPAFLHGLAMHGSRAGMKRTDVTFGEPPGDVKLALSNDKLVMGLGPAPDAVALPFHGTSLEIGSEDRYGARAWALPQITPPLGESLLEAIRFQWGDRAARVMAWSSTAVGRVARATRAFLKREPPAGRDQYPCSVPFVDDASSSGEHAWLRPKASVPGLLSCDMRLEPGASDARLYLVAIDTLRLELGWAAGVEHPHASASSPGCGRAPVEHQSRLVAAFNGGAAEPALGAVSDGRVLVPPRGGVPTVAIDGFGRAHLGTWRNGMEHERFVALTQTRPYGDEQDGEASEERSALCLTSRGFLIYAWARATTGGAAAFARALDAVGCREVVPLDGSPGHAGFAFLATAVPEVAFPGATVPPRTFLDGRARDFFYLIERDPRPPASTKLNWQRDAGAGPPPDHTGAVHRAQTSPLGVEVTLRAFAPGRFAWNLRPGSRERGGRTALGALVAQDHARALVAIGLGVAAKGDNRRGLVLDGVLSLPIRPDLGLLSISKDGERISVARSLSDMTPDGDATELVLAAEAGEVRSEARRLGPRRRRSAACTLGDGTLLVAEASSDSDEPSTAALLAAGCRRVVVLNRGKQVEAFIHRANTDDPPRDSYEDTTLYGLSREARGTAQPL